MSTYLARRAVPVLLLSMVAASAALAQNTNRGGAMRFAEMDTNGDGVITRREWRGNDRSFEVQDWNEDGILSGDEVQQGTRRRPADRFPANEPAGYHDWTAAGFSALDRNRDGRISRNEWQDDVETFRRVDRNGDAVLSRAEFLGDISAGDGNINAGRSGESIQMRNSDERFESVDTNNDGRLSRGEWRGTAERFNALDENRDGVLTRAEFGTPRETGSEARSESWKQGYARGIGEGRQAGREDKQMRNQWDLEGQRELETADNGYEAHFGARAEYQEGYREGFRSGYRQGFGPR